MKEDVKVKVLSSRTVLNGGEREQEHGIGASEERGSKPGPTYMVESWTRGLSSLNSQLCHECETREQRIVLSPRTDLNGGERGQEQVRQAKRQKEEVEGSSQDQPKWWRAGFSQPFWSLPLPLRLPLCPPLSLPLFLPFFPPFRGKVLTFLGCNREKRSILVPCGIIPFGAFGWAFAFAHGILSRVKAGIDSTRRRRSCGRGCGGGGWRRQGGAGGMPIGGWFRGTARGSGGEGGDEGLKVEGGFTFGRLQGGFQGGLKGASRRLQGGLKGASPSEGFKGA